MKALIQEAADFLRGRIRVTPVEPSPELSERLGVETWLKLEHLQLTGSFKIRGAWFHLARLGEQPALTCSAGNHGKAMAWAARQLGRPVTICVPRSVDAAKLAGMRELGADVRVAEFPGYDDTEAWARELARRENLRFVSPFDDDAIMAANGGTLAAETCEQIPGLAAALVPVGGGGLAAGFCTAAEGVAVTGCQHRDSPALALSLERGEAVTRLPAIATLAGGVEGGIGRRTFAILRDRIAGAALVSEAEIREGVRWMLARHQYLIEPTAAVTVAAALSGRLRLPRGPAVVLVCGRNVGYDTVREVLCG
jgi:threonine dehydratase